MVCLCTNLGRNYRTPTLTSEKSGEDLLPIVPMIVFTTVGPYILNEYTRPP